MSYDYLSERPRLMTDEGQRMFLKIRDAAHEKLKSAGAVAMGSLLIGSGDTWNMMACVDRLVEIGELLEVPNPHSRAGQHRLFISAKFP